jgi:hypothetical protein
LGIENNWQKIVNIQYTIINRFVLLLGFQSAAASKLKKPELIKGKLICQELEKVPQYVKQGDGFIEP